MTKCYGAKKVALDVWKGTDKKYIDAEIKRIIEDGFIGGKKFGILHQGGIFNSSLIVVPDLYDYLYKKGWELISVDVGEGKCFFKRCNKK